ncbi:MAG: hypothetical protein QNJ55_29760 [Xenococcus sp. MO_188.B8]|nr:hypothetical protein [Xenococcus sp. MO_188.B8]
MILESLAAMLAIGAENAATISSASRKIPTTSRKTEREKTCPLEAWHGIAKKNGIKECPAPKIIRKFYTDSVPYPVRKLGSDLPKCIVTGVAVEKSVESANNAAHNLFNHLNNCNHQT